MSKINRRDFIKTTGAAVVALGAVSIGCAPKNQKKEQPKTNEMEYRYNAKNGDKVSLLGYGCMRWPMIKTEDGGAIVDQEAVNELIDQAMKNGVNYYDTAPMYLGGLSEEATAKALIRYPRESYFLATKLSNFNDFSYEAAMKMYKQSFERLQTDYIDYYLLHSVGSGGKEVFEKRYIENGVLDFLLKEREAGRIRQLGFSFHGTTEEFREIVAYHDKYHWDFVQIQMNYMDWNHADGRRNANASELYAELDSREIPITIMEPLQGGRLASLPENVVAKLKEREPNASSASWAFRFAGTYPRILTVLSGMTYASHLEDNLSTYQGFKPLSEEELQFIDVMAGLIKDYPLIECTGCAYCMPCPYGIDIPGIFKYYNTCVTEGSIPQNENQKQYRKLRREYLTGYNKAIPTIKQADHCISCGNCMELCPQRIKIPVELQRIDTFVENLKRS